MHIAHGGISYVGRKSRLVFAVFVFGKGIAGFTPRCHMPAVESTDKKPLYLNSKYNEILNAFLGNKHLPLGAGGIMNPARSKGQSAKRKMFLEKFIKIWYGHWGGYWQLISYPEANSITFDKEMKYARIDFRMVYEGGEAILKRENGIWKLISAKRTWIE